MAISYAVPASCEELVTGCCDTLASDWQRQNCHDVLDAAPSAGWNCAAGATELKQRSFCPSDSDSTSFGGAPGAGGQAASGESGQGDASGAGVGPQSERSLCCYETCGYTHYT